MRSYAAFLLALVLASLACGQYVPTVTPIPTVTPTARPSLTPASTQPPTQRATAEPIMAIVKAAVINVRAEPDGEVIAILNAGNTVKLLDNCSADNWCKVQFGSAGVTVTGYIWKGCLRLKSELGCSAR
jgi:hypothetical protein